MYKSGLNYVILHHKQLIRFILIGVLTFLVNFVSFHIAYANLKLNSTLSASLAYFVTVVAHFCLHRGVTFRANEQKIIVNISRYVFLLLISYLNVLVVMTIVVSYLKLSPYIGLFLQTASSFFISFFVMKYFVFCKKLSVS